MKSTAQNTIENSPINADHANLSTLPAIRESSVASNLATDLDQDSIATSSGPLKIPFTPGDHITRWEMLPIAWPIQVHGIVLEVFTDSIVLVDFGLAAVLDPTVEAKEGANADSEGSEITQENNKKQLKVKRAIESFQKSLKKKKEKQRLNVRTLTEQKEISKWSKVNYDGGLFRFGGGDEKKDDTIASSDGSTVEEKGDSWWSSWKKSQPQENPKPFGRNEDSDSPRNTKADDNTSEKLKGESSRASWWSRLSSKRDMKAEVEDSLRSRSQPDDRDSKLGDVLYPVGNDDAAGNDTINLAMELERRYMREQHGAVDAKQNESLAAKADHSEEEKHVDSKSKEDIFWSKNDLIQADTAIVENDPSEEKKEDEEVFADVGKKNFEEAVLEPTVEVETKEIVVSKQKRKLSRADPAKLVLARTNWLLKHGESILPPYHAFSSNSECMAGTCIQRLKTNCALLLSPI